MNLLVSPSSLGHRPALDGVRAFAILAVLGRHTGWLEGGYLGVDIFFTLSGFLITTLLVEEYAATGGLAIRRFYARRALRLLPALVLMVLVSQAYLLLLAPAGYLQFRLWQAGVVLFYAGNVSWLFGLPGLGVLGHTWSLAIEEQFYLLWPLALLALLRVVRARVFVTIAVAATAIGAMLWRATVVAGGADLNHVYQRPDTHADPLLIGCLAALLVSWGHLEKLVRPGIVRLAGPVGALTLGLLCWRLQWPGDFATHHVSGLAGVATALVLVNVIVRPGGVLGQLLQFRPLRALGRISYGVYLWHFPVLFAWGAWPAANPYRPGGSVLAIAAGLATTLAISIASWIYLERPALRLKARFAATGRGTGRRLDNETPAVLMAP